MTADGPGVVCSTDALGKGKVVIVAVPGTFTPGFSNVRLSGFIECGVELKERGVAQIACIAVNDVFVTDAWGKAHGVGNDILMTATASSPRRSGWSRTRRSSGSWPAPGMVLDGSGLGSRSKRYAAILQDRRCDQPRRGGGSIETTTCSNLLTKL